jgi:SAM-dependent methyltransferase
VSSEYLRALRQAEVDAVLERYRAHFSGAAALEIGSGSGVQLDALSSCCASIVGVEVRSDAIGREKHPRILMYDGVNLPFSSSSFDVVFSSNVLEHVERLDLLQKEIARVLKPGGVCIHVLPTHLWKLWTTAMCLCLAPPRVLKVSINAIRGRTAQSPKGVSAWLDLLVGERHGVVGGRMSEAIEFNPRSWRRRFVAQGWEVVEAHPMGLAYEGNVVFGSRLGLNARRQIAAVLGSACHVFLVRRAGHG